MALFPQQFIDDLKHQADIVAVIQEYVTLKKLGANYKGLCPFHSEKTPSFQVDRDRGFFHCFGCNAGGDVIRFLQMHDKLEFVDAVKALAQRFGMTLPETEQTAEQKANAAERESLLKVHEAAAAWFVSQLASNAGTRIRRQIAGRGISEETSRALGLGFAPPSRDALRTALTGMGYSQALLVRAGLLVQREDGTVIDRFRNRLMIPICRESGPVIAFGGRAVEADQQPKYLNSPETGIYSKGQTLYGLNLAKHAIRQGKVAVLVEGYFDFAQVYQAGFQSVVASCGTALTTQQARLLHRFAGSVVLSFDPDAAGQGAAVKLCEMLAGEGFKVSVATLPGGEDPDTFIRKHGPAGYRQQLAQAKPYLEYLLDRAAAGRDLNSDEGRLQFLTDMLPVAARIPDAPTRDRFADRLAHRSRVTEEVVRAEIRKAIVHKQPLARPHAPSFARVTKAEKALIWSLMHQPEEGLAALRDLRQADLAGLVARSVLDLALKLNEDRGFSPSVLLERLSMTEAQLVTTIASEPEPPAWGLGSCVREIQRSRYVEERAALQREIDQLQSSGSGDSQEMNTLLARKLDLGRRIQALVSSEE